METDMLANVPSPHSGESTVPPQPGAIKPFAPGGESSAGVVGYTDEGWSWGGFTFNLMFAIAIREYKYLFFLVLMFVPIVNFVVMIGMMIYFGSKGRELARGSVTFSNKDQYLGFMKGLDHAGKIVAYFYIIILVIGIGAAVVLASLAGARDRASDSYLNYEQSKLETQQLMTQEEVE